MQRLDTFRFLKFIVKANVHFLLERRAFQRVERPVHFSTVRHVIWVVPMNFHGANLLVLNRPQAKVSASRAPQRLMVFS